MRTTTTVYTSSGSVEIAVSEAALNGLNSWITQSEAMASRHILYPATADGSYEIHSIAADGSYQVQFYVDGRLSSTAAYTSDDILIQSLSFGYDEFGRQDEVTDSRLQTMTTWQDYLGEQGAAVTTWTYDLERGWLDKKYDAENEHVDYDYTPAGRLKMRTWSRGISTNYSYDNAGRLNTTDYSDATPDIHYSYTRFGQIEEVRDGTLSNGTISDEDLRYRHSYTYDDYLRPLTEQMQTHGDYTLTRSYESSGAGQVPGRYRGYSLTESGQTPILTAATYGYDNAGRLNSVSATNPTAGVPAEPDYSYHYRNDSNLIDYIKSPAHTTLYAYQPRGNQVRSVINHTRDRANADAFLPDTFTPTHSELVSRFDYRYNKLGQREDVAQSGAAFALDAASPAAGGSVFDYTYNAKGEVTGADRYEGANPDNLLTPILPETFSYTFDDIGNREDSTRGTDTTTYTPDILNQYTSVTSAASTVNPTHDEDGNLLTDGTNSYTWNGENRLFAVTPLNPADGDKKLSFSYDYQGRRVSKTVETYDLASTSYLPTSSFFYLYDGWNLIAEFKSLHSSPFTLHSSYTWGLDLSVSLQGAGGVGGLLAVHDETTDSTYSPGYDANGNVVGYFDNSNGALVAHFEYGPFGELIRATGEKKDDFNFRFSTKYQDSETGLLYYGYRYYNVETGRWLGRDPVEEKGGLNLYNFVNNNSLDYFDVLGLWVDQAQAMSNYYRRAGGVPPPRSQWKSVKSKSFSAESSAVLEQAKAVLFHLPVGSISPISLTLIWVPYPGGKWDVVASISGSIQKCCKKDGKESKMANVSVSVETSLSIGYGAGGNQRLVKSKTSPTGLRKDKGQPGGGQFAKNPATGSNDMSISKTLSSSAPLPPCESSLTGNIVIEVGGKAGAGLTGKVYVNQAFPFDEPIALNIDYGASFGLSGYVGAEFYISATANGIGTLDLSD